MVSGRLGVPGARARSPAAGAPRIGQELVLIPGLSTSEKTARDQLIVARLVTHTTVPVSYYFSVRK